MVFIFLTFFSLKSGKEDIAKLLIENGADIEKVLYSIHTEHFNCETSDKTLQKRQ